MPGTFFKDLPTKATPQKRPEFQSILLKSCLRGTSVPRCKHKEELKTHRYYCCLAFFLPLILFLASSLCLPGLPPPALQALCKLISASEAGEQLISRVGGRRTEKKSLLLALVPTSLDRLIVRHSWVLLKYTQLYC